MCYSLSCVQLLATPWTVARQAPLSMKSSRQEYWNGLPLPSPGDLPEPRIESGSPALQADALLSKLLPLLSRFSRVWLCVTPQMAAHKAPPSLGFPRQEHWSGLPFPSPMRESESEVVSDPQRPHGLQATRLLHPWDFPGNSTGVGCHCLLRFNC